MQLPGRRASLIAALAIGFVVAAMVTVAALARPPDAALSTAAPANGDSVATPPAAIILTFTTEVVEAHVTVGGGPNSVAPAIDGRTVRQPVTITVAGRYPVTYHVVARSGDSVSGTLSFIVVGSGPARQLGPAEHRHGEIDALTATMLVTSLLVVLVLAVQFVRTHPVRRDPG